MKKLLFLIPLLFLLTGCFNYKEIDDLAIVSAVSIDKENEKYLVSVQIINTQKVNTASSQSASEFYVFKGKGDTVQEGIRNVVDTSSRRIYFNHNQLLVISEDIIKDNIDFIFDLPARDSESREDYPVIISKNVKAYEILETLTTIDNINAFNINNSIKNNNEYKGTIISLSLFDLIKDKLNPYKDLSIPTISLEGNKKDNDSKKEAETTDLKSYLKLQTMAIFKDNKFVTYLDEKKSFGINMLNNKVKHTIVSYECKKDSFISLELYNPKAKYSFDNNDLNINIKSKMALSESHCSYDLKKDSTLKEIEKNTEKHLKSIVNDTIKTVYYDYNTKVLMIDELMHKYKKKSINKINVNVELELTSSGNTQKEI